MRPLSRVRNPMEIRKLLGITAGHIPYQAALAELAELGEEAATPAILSTLGTRLATASQQQAEVIVKILLGMGPDGADALRDAMMRLCLSPEGSFFYRPKPVPPAPSPYSWPPEVTYGIELFPPSAAWERLGMVAARTWIEQMAPVLCGLPFRSEPPPKEAPRIARIVAIPVRPPDTELRQWLVLDLVAACVRGAPEAFDGIHRVFTSKCPPAVTLGLAHRLTQPVGPDGPGLRIPIGTRKDHQELQRKEWLKAPIHTIPEGSREMILGRLLELAGEPEQTAKDGVKAIAIWAIDEIGRMRGHAAGDRTAAKLIELVSKGKPAVARRAAEVLIEIHHSEDPPPARAALLRLLWPDPPVVANLGEWFTSGLPLAQVPHKVRQPSIFERLALKLATSENIAIRDVEPNLDKRLARAVPPPPPDSLTSLIEDIINVARKTPDARLVEMCIPLLNGQSPLVQWCGLRIAGSVGGEYWPAPVEPLIEPVLKLTADRDEAVRKEAEFTLATLRAVQEINAELARVDQDIKALDPSLPPLEYARQLLSVLKAPATRLPERPVRRRRPGESQTSVPVASPIVDAPEMSASLIAAITDLGNPEKHEQTIEAFHHWRGLWWENFDRHVELLPILQPVVLAREDSPEILRRAFADVLEQNATSPEAMESFGAIGAALGSANGYTRKVARTLAAEIAPFADLLSPSVFALTGDGDRQTRLWALSVLASFRRMALPAEVVERLPEWLAEKDPEMRWHGARIAGQLGVAACNGAVIAGLRGLIENPRIVFENRMHYRLRPDYVRIQAIGALGALGDGAVKDTLYLLLNLMLDPDIEVGAAAVRAAFSMGGDARFQALDTLASALEASGVFAQ